VTAEADDAALEAGRLLFARECRFVAGAATSSAIPPSRLTEIAFAGRSNVGKSSLVNALTGRKTLARTSHTPGRTRQINFFELAGAMMLVDLPGYGYARAARSEIKEWTGMVRDYLKGRATLRRVLVLIDGRHGVKPSDEAIMTMLDEAAVSYQGVLTKTDKVTPSGLEAVTARTLEALSRHGAAHPEVLATSSVSGAGIPELKAMLAALAGAAPNG